MGKGEELCRIPESLHITAATIQAQIPELWRRVMRFKKMTVEQRAEIAQVVLLASLLHDAEDRAIRSSFERSRPVCGMREGRSSIWAAWDSYADGLLHDNFNDHPYMRAAADPHALWLELQP